MPSDPPRAASPGVELVERQLAERFGREHCVLLGSGTTALYCAFAALAEGAGAEHPALLFPDITCETAVNAGVFAGCRPLFCDVRLDDYVMCADSALRHLRDSECLAVVPTHIFGHLVDVAALENLVEDPVAIVEDAAQGYGGTLDAQRAGGMGHASVLSFGPGKLLDCGGGGALLCDDGAFAAHSRAIAARLVEHAADPAAHRAAVMKEMMAARKRFRGAHDRPQLVHEQQRILREHRGGYLSLCDDRRAEGIREMLPVMGSIVRQRQELTEELDEFLRNSEGVRVPARRGRPGLWRYSFLVDEQLRKDRVGSLKREGLAVSCLFPPCTEKFSASGDRLPNSRTIARTIVNLHLPPGVAPSSLLEAVRRVFT